MPRANPRRDHGRIIAIGSSEMAPILMDLAAVPSDHTAGLEHGDFESHYLGYAFSGRKVSVVTDSDECGLLSLTPAAVNQTPVSPVFERPGARFIPKLALLADIRSAMAVFVRLPRNTVRRDVFRQSVRWHAADLDETFLQEEARIDELITDAIGDYYSDPSYMPKRFSNPRYWTIDLFGVLQYCIRYARALPVLARALLLNGEERVLVLRKLSALAKRYFGTAN
jgi:hypothetical protein